MTYVFTGDNNFEIVRAVDELCSKFIGTIERIDGSGLELNGLPDLLTGQSLFSEKRLIIIKGLSDNKTVWPVLGEWLPRISDDIQLVLVEPTLDKRTKTYKDLQRITDIKAYKAWGEHDILAATKWVEAEAKHHALTLQPALARQLVERLGTDQWGLYYALEKLAVLDTVDSQVIESVVEANPIESVFDIFQTALTGDRQRLSEILATLELSEDPYRVFGLLSGQAFQLATLSVADKSAQEVAKDIATHPFVISKLAPYAKVLGRKNSKKVIQILADTDVAMKTSGIDPWVLLTRGLMKITALK